LSSVHEAPHFKSIPPSKENAVCFPCGKKMKQDFPKIFRELCAEREAKNIPPAIGHIKNGAGNQPVAISLRRHLLQSNR